MNELVFTYCNYWRLGYWFVKEYNSLQAQAQGVKAGHSNIQTALNRKVDTINQLIPVVEGYGNHEKIIYLKVSDNLKEMASKSAQVVQNIQALAAAYPQLKANENYQKLMNQIVTLESEIQNRRLRYNQIVEFYNSHLKSLPICLVAKSLGFQEAQYFDFDNDVEIKSFQGADEQILVDMLKSSSSKIKDTVQNEVVSPVKKQLEKANEAYSVGEKDTNRKKEE